ncbi:hypothetical protein [Actinomadura napierensis]|uniref:Uncharacterized protein n=1 Tax=Actinomadura napierensis TaxID=267854 RepID=A0ABN2Z824_9ACTN
MLPLAHAIPLNNDTVSPGLLGFGVFLALLVALVFLVRSMNKQMKRIQAPREADLKQQEWERAQAARAAAAADKAGEEPAGSA